MNEATGSPDCSEGWATFIGPLGKKDQHKHFDQEPSWGREGLVGRIFLSFETENWMLVVFGDTDTML